MASRRNPVARSLKSSRFRPRVVRSKTTYTRKTKHRKKDEAHAPERA